MNKKVYNAVKERSGGQCENCGAPYTQEHHIFGGNGRRKKCEMVETVFDLCWACHEGPEGVHFNRELDLKLKIKATQNLIDIGWSKEKIINFVGRWYLDDTCD
ncbi:hypothetical protein [Rhodopseudomonas parapalustris]